MKKIYPFLSLLAIILAYPLISLLMVLIIGNCYMQGVYILSLVYHASDLY